jgi:hypothetical protein
MNRSRLVMLTFAVLALGWASQARSVRQQAPAVAGTWKGLLEAAHLNVVFHIAAAPDGKLTATMDSPDQGVNGIPVSQVTFADSTLKLTVAAVQGGFEGKLGGNGKFTGEWRQGAAVLPLVLEKVPAPAKAPAPAPASAAHS